MSKDLDKFLAAAANSVPNARAIICPHAGYTYSGPVAGYSFKHMVPGTFKRIFILGPAHHLYLRKCGLFEATTYETPVGSLAVDQKTIAALAATGLFQRVGVNDDEDEHSLEMQLPFIAHIMQGHKFEGIVPVLVGHIDGDYDTYGRVFASYLADPDNFFVISSDFCHWGKRFQYQWDDGQHPRICDAIKWLDHQGMDAITTKDPEVFARYLQKYKNTICGRNPILVLLAAIKNSKPEMFDIQFVKYAQSSAVLNKNDSSVSYAAGVVSIKQ